VVHVELIHGGTLCGGGSKSGPCGGELEYLHRSPASHKRRQKGNVVLNETVRFGLKFCGTWTRQ
jgi:hypothetical protein